MSNKRLEKMCTDEILSLAELKEDLYFKKLPEDKIKYYVYESIKIGEEAAKKIICSNPNKNIRDICEDKKIKIELKTDEYDFEIIQMRGKYDAIEKKILLYDKSIKWLEDEFKKMKVDKMFDYETIAEIHIAHELFHYLEIEEIDYVYDKLDKAVIFKMGPIKKNYPIVKTSDIAAHIFCKNVLNLPFNPKIMDYYYLIGKGYIDFDYLENYFRELDEIIKCN